MSASVGRRHNTYADPVIFRDDRVLLTLLSQETSYLPDHFIYSDPIAAKMRKDVADWMLEVCEAQNCRPEIFCLAMNYVDRFLSICPVRKPPQLQLLGAVCLLVAGKLRQPEPLSASKLVEYSNLSLGLADIMEWEVLLLSKLEWDMSAVVSSDYIEHILQRLDRTGRFSETVRQFCDHLTVTCASHHAFSSATPSLIAAASVVLAFKSMLSDTDEQVFVDVVSQIALHDQESVKECISQIEAVTRPQRPERPQSPNQSPVKWNSATPKMSLSFGTPTKVLDVAKEH